MINMCSLEALEEEYGPKEVVRQTVTAKPRVCKRPISNSSYWTHDEMFNLEDPFFPYLPPPFLPPFGPEKIKRNVNKLGQNSYYSIRQQRINQQRNGKITKPDVAIEIWMKKLEKISKDSVVEKLITLTEEFTGKNVDRDVFRNQSLKKIHRLVVDQIPEDRWIRFLRTTLGLTRNEVDALEEYGKSIAKSQDALAEYREFTNQFNEGQLKSCLEFKPNQHNSSYERSGSDKNQMIWKDRFPPERTRCFKFNSWVGHGEVKRQFNVSQPGNNLRHKPTQYDVSDGRGGYDESQMICEESGIRSVLTRDELDALIDYEIKWLFNGSQPENKFPQMPPQYDISDGRGGYDESQMICEESWIRSVLTRDEFDALADYEKARWQFNGSQPENSLGNQPTQYDISDGRGEYDESQITVMPEVSRAKNLPDGCDRLDGYGGGQFQKSKVLKNSLAQNLPDHGSMNGRKNKE